MTKERTHRSGHWLPAKQEVLDNFLQDLIKDVKKRPEPLHPIIEDFKELIENDAQVYMLFHQMFEQVPRKPPYNKDPTLKPQVRDYRVMLQLFNAIMTRAPEYNRTGLVGFPINAILDWPMGTEAGLAAFLNEKINAQIRAMLAEWARFLGSKDSVYVLNKDPKKGWFGKDAMEDMKKVNFGSDFDPSFQCDPDAPHHGFTSWDNFFTRLFRPGVRPIASPDDNKVIVNACESAPYRVVHNVKARDRFWIKGQPYSLNHMLADDSFAPQFVGGTVYQAFLSALSYHRWHSPVDGKVVKAYVQNGTYYSEASIEGFDNPKGPDPSGPNDSQGYITEVATRAMIFIEADNADIGLMCIMPVGMAEVSTCEITVYEGQHVKKGDELGMFHFGGSTHCLIFRPGVKLTFDMHGLKPGITQEVNIPVNSRIATVG
jgi:phosphatidylserine decarboxylase